MTDLDIKRTLNLKRLMMAVAMTACMTSHAFGATLKAESTILHDRITLGDVFDGVTENADYFLAPAPAMGKSVTLSAADLTRISDAFNLGWTPENSLQHAVIRRASGTIDASDIQAAVKEMAAVEMKGRKFDLELSDRAVSLRIPESGDKSLTVENFAVDAVKGLFSATVSADAVPNVKKTIKGRLYLISQVPVLKDPMRPGDVISSSDIDYIDMRAADITPTTVVDAKRLIGETPRRGIAALKPVAAGDIQLPVVVKKGDMVTMFLKAGAISLTAQGRALDSGAEGDAIRIMNTASKQVVDAVVTGSQTVSIRLPSTNTL